MSNDAKRMTRCRSTMIQQTGVHIDDFDKRNENKLHEVHDYAFEIFENMRHREANFKINKDYMTLVQTDISEKMRCILVDWLVKVQDNFGFTHETLYFAVKLIDLYLSKISVSVMNLQLIGITCLWIASKFEETKIPCSDDILYICNGAYTKQQLINTEMSILLELDYDINVPTPYRFLRRFAKCGKTSMETLTLARYLLELSLHQIKFVSKSASKLAAASLLLALKLQNKKQEWTPSLEFYTCYNKSELTDSAAQLLQMINNTKLLEQCDATQKKYAHKLFYKVSERHFDISEESLSS